MAIPASRGEAPPVLELAPAKVNLCLHVTGRRTDGYHELDTLVAFADIGDTVSLESADHGVFLQVPGGSAPISSDTKAAVVPGGVDNLAWRALAAAARAAGGMGGAVLTLEKRLPARAGLGGGSSDAAAVFRAMARVVGGRLPRPGAASAAAALGADVPMCLEPRPWRARGIGGLLAPVRLARDLPAVLVWPGRPLGTPAVFRAYSAAGTATFGLPVPEAAIHALGRDPVAALAGLRNDLTDAAARVEPAVAAALEALRSAAGCRLARMTGSGSAAFGLFDRTADAETAAAALSRLHARWWVRATTLRAGRIETALAPGTTG